MKDKKTQAFEIELSDGRILAIAPDEGVNVCYATFDDDDYLLYLDISADIHRLYSNTDCADQKEQIKIVKRTAISVEITEDASSNVAGIKPTGFATNCCITGGCCNCGWGWICNSCGIAP